MLNTQKWMSIINNDSADKKIVLSYKLSLTYFITKQTLGKFKYNWIFKYIWIFENWSKFYSPCLAMWNAMETPEMIKNKKIRIIVN